jgi:hypothetical protein
MSTIYEIQKLPGSPDEHPFIIAQNSKEHGRCRSAKLCFRLLRSVFIGVRPSEFLFHKCSLLAEIGLADPFAHLT